MHKLFHTNLRLGCLVFTCLSQLVAGVIGDCKILNKYNSKSTKYKCLTFQAELKIASNTLHYYQHFDLTLLL